MDKKCQICQVEEFKYKCPRCFRKTCSLLCTQTHKSQHNCPGTAQEPTKYVSKSELKQADTEDEQNLLVQRDYNFLIGMNRKLDVLKKDGKAKNKRALYSSNYNSSKRHHSIRDDETTEPQVNKVIRRGVQCLLLPKGMLRSLQNKSKWDKPLDCFVWSLEWCILQPDSKFAHTSHRNKETDSLVGCVGKSVFDKICDVFQLEEDSNVESSKQTRSDRLLSSGLRFYTKWFPKDTSIMMDSKKLIRLDPSKCIGELFRDKTVIEFPTVYVAKDDASIGSDFKLAHDSSGDSSSSEESSSSSEDSSSSSDDSESTSSSSSSSSSSDDESPDENPSKPSKKEAVLPESDDDYTPGISLDFLAD